MPALPLDRFANWSGDPHELIAYFKEPYLREALYLASPGFESRFEAGERATGRKRRKFLNALTRYFARMCTRPTPLGLQAGVTSGRITDVTALRMGDLRERHTSLDVDYLAASVSAMTAE